VLNELNLVPNTAKDVVDLFDHKLMDEDLLSAGLGHACSCLLGYLAEAESRFAKDMVLDHKGREICVRFDRSGNTRKWILNSKSEKNRFSCMIGPDELSFYSFLKAGLAPTQDAATSEIRGLSTILGQKPDAFRWNQIVWPSRRKKDVLHSDVPTEKPGV